MNDEAIAAKWRIWYGGEVDGLGSDHSEIVCLHSLTNNKISNQVMKSISWTSLEGARKLVLDGKAVPEDFLVFCGYAGWYPGQLMDELDRDCWHAVATDSTTVWDELQASAENTSTDITGIDVWERLMDRTGRGHEVRTIPTDFDDKMLHEWAQKNLVFDDDGLSIVEKNALYIALTSSSDETFAVGSLLRGSSADHFPFLLSNQEFHRSVILVTENKPNFTVSVLLNQPTTDAIEWNVPDDNGQTRSVKIPKRHGGRFGVMGDLKKPDFWFHFSQALRKLGVGSPLGNPLGIWRCTERDAYKAFCAGVASEKDFIAVSGFHVWPNGMTVGEMAAKGFEAKSNFDPVLFRKTRKVWDQLVSQETLSALTLDTNRMLGRLAWIESGGIEQITLDLERTELCDDALRCWMCAYLLGEPVLRHSNSTFG